MVSFCVFLVAFTFVTAMKASLLPDDRYFNEADPCDDFRYDGRRLPFAEVVVGERLFDSKNCGMVVPIDEVNTEIPIVRFSEVRTLAFFCTVVLLVVVFSRSKAWFAPSIIGVSHDLHDTLYLRHVKPRFMTV